MYYIGQLVSLAGTWMQDVALSWLVVTLTGSPVALGLTMTIRFAPALLFSLHGGLLADRLPKRSTLVAAQVTQLVVALVLAVLTSLDLVTVMLIYVLAGVRGIIDSIEGPARQAFVPEMVGTTDLPNAIALNSTLFNAARIVGPAIGAGVISALGGGLDAIAACFYINAASFLAVVVALMAMRSSELRTVRRVAQEDTIRQLREGFRYVRATPEVIVIFIVMGMVGGFGYNFPTMLPLITKWLLDAGAATLSLLTTAMGIGSVIAGLFVAYRGRPSQRLLLVSAGLLVVILVLVALSTSTSLTTALLFVAGVLGILFMTTANTRLQTLAPDHLRGRVMGIYILLFLGTIPIGSYLIGVLAEYAGVRISVLTMAGLCAAGVIAGSAYARCSSARCSGGPEPDPALTDDGGAWSGGGAAGLDEGAEAA